MGGDPNNGKCFRCGNTNESYDEFIHRWKVIVVEGDCFDFCDNCVEIILRSFYCYKILTMGGKL